MSRLDTIQDRFDHAEHITYHGWNAHALRETQADAGDDMEYLLTLATKTREALEKVQWYTIDLGYGGFVKECPICHGVERSKNTPCAKGHTEDCSVGKLLTQLEEE